jgi:hypothetical protein
MCIKMYNKYNAFKKANISYKNANNNVKIKANKIYISILL